MLIIRPYSYCAFSRSDTSLFLEFLLNKSPALNPHSRTKPCRTLQLVESTQMSQNRSCTVRESINDAVWSWDTRDD
ncbi:hypothetical protein RSAG8_11504, partial [Rhizoctonia solani AG-8 WAC10335]